MVKKIISQPNKKPASTKEKADTTIIPTDTTASDLTEIEQKEQSEKIAVATLAFSPSKSEAIEEPPPPTDDATQQEGHKDGFTMPESTPHGNEGEVTAGFDTQTFFGNLLNEAKSLFTNPNPETTQPVTIETVEENLAQQTTVAQSPTEQSSSPQTPTSITPLSQPPAISVNDITITEDQTEDITLSSPSGADTTIADAIGVGTIISNETEPELLHHIVINEIGLERGTSVEKVKGSYQVANEDQNYIELVSLDSQGKISVNQLRDLRIQIIDKEGNLVDPDENGFTIDLSQTASISAVPAKGFLIIYEDGTWAINKPGGSGELNDIVATGTFEDENGDPISFDWNLGSDTTNTIAVNLVQVEEDNKDNITSQGSLDMFVANDADPSLLIGDTGWEGDSFNGEATEQYIFTRVFGPEITGKAGGGAPVPGDSFPTDTNQAQDWTTSTAPTERSYNNSSVDDDTNPLDPNDNLNPLQGQDVNLENAGQTILTGTTGDDVLDGGRGPDIIDGKAGNDTLQGGDHNDYIVGGEGADIITGGSGADTIVDTSAARADTIDGGTGLDTFNFTAGINTGSLSLTTTPSSDPLTITNIEILDMNDGDIMDTLTLDRDRVIELGMNNDTSNMPVTSETGNYANSVNLYVKGDGDGNNTTSDNVTLTNSGWTNTGDTISVGTDTYTVYANDTGAEDAIVAIHQNLNIETPDS